MLVYLDDSGCGGFKFGKGSTSHLVIAACVFQDPIDVFRAVEIMDDCAHHNGLLGEFKYSERSDKTKACFFACIESARFSVRAIIVDKSKIYSNHLRSSPSALKSYAIRMLLTKNFGQIRDAKLFIDGQDTGAFGVTDERYLLRMVNRESPGTLSAVRFVDSRASRPIQLADMIAGAINAAVRTDREQRRQHLRTFFPRTYRPEGTYWHFREAN